MLANAENIINLIVPELKTDDGNVVLDISLKSTTNIEDNDNLQMCINETKIKLKNILSLSKTNHKLQIMKQNNVKYAHIYCKINQLSVKHLDHLLNII